MTTATDLIGQTRIRITVPVTVVDYLSDRVVITEEPGDLPTPRRGVCSVAEFLSYRAQS